MTGRLALALVAALGIALPSCGDGGGRPTAEAPGGLALEGLGDPPAEIDAGDLDHVFPVFGGPNSFDRDYETRQGARKLLYRDALNEHLEVVYVAELATSMHVLCESDVEHLGLAGPALRARAVDNLRRALPEIRVRDHEGVHQVVAGGDAEALLLLDDELWDRPDLTVAGEHVAAVPRAGMLLVTGSRDTDGLAKLRRLARRYFDYGDYAISSALFVRRDGRWMPLPK